MGTGDMAVTVGRKLPVHDRLFFDLHKKDILFVTQIVVIAFEVYDPRHGNRIADHGGLGHTGSDMDRHERAFFRIAFTVISIHRVGVARLYTDNFGQFGG
jgi:hypothetical protein